ncbi:hypothetical protein JTB14_031779 [Gonioctena quinquepunctata]|nr:hypothetical protein JTB14_031779 [Gonioctena quinquepunctata]
MERHCLVDLETMDTEELYDFIDGISEEQAVDSDVGGDSDADDQIVHEERPQKVIRKDIIQRIVNESHIYAQQRGLTFDTTIEEMKAFFEFLIIMGFHNLPSIRLYWSTDQNMRVSRIANTISLKHVSTILRYLHINNENAPKKGDPNFDKLYKLKPMVTHLNQKFNEFFSPARQLSIDESMVGFKGLSSLKQYMPMKPTKRGFKITPLRLR